MARISAHRRKQGARRARWCVGAGLLLAGSAGGCGSGNEPERVAAPLVPEAERGSAFFDSESPAGLGRPTAEGVGPASGLATPDPASDRPVQEGEACAVTQAQATLQREPVDIIVVLDNSGSMSEELDAVERNLNVNFADVLESSGVDYRLILISRHRKAPRTETGEASTSVCITQPLSPTQDCDSAPHPAFGPRFFHYNTKVESTDSLQIVLDTYQQPIPEGYEDRSDNAPEGWSAWLRAGAKKVFLELTDDDSELDSERFVEQLTTLAPQHFATQALAPSFVFHSIVGLAEKDPPTEAYLDSEPLQSRVCTAQSADIDDAGDTYQELSILTGGLRFPLCQFDAYDVVFQSIAEDVVVRSLLACDFAIPEPPTDAMLDLDRVAISHRDENGLEVGRLGQAPDPSSCQSDAFTIEAGRLTLCPEACEVVRRDPGARLDVLFTCESQLPF